jgi:23S rRNA (cytidine1920-2'-O)/16S rRNA (cytidine1409-2'-O)-methyltransferase
MAGKVLVNQEPVDKPGARVSDQDTITLKGEVIAYVSRGGIKLEAALQHFGISAADAVCLDVGASTGGFTDCLLQNSARRVYAVDVGYGQLDWKLRQDPRVVVIERTNIRHMPPELVADAVDLAVVDVSFISLKIVVPAVMKFIRPGSRMILLVKPQFEVGRGRVGKGGVVREPQLHQQVIEDLTKFFESLGLTVAGTIASPITGPKGNKEFLIYLKTDASKE